MSDDNQLIIPPSFIQLFVPPGRTRPSASREAIAERYEFCEDLASMLTEPSKTTLWELGITETDVLQRTYRGLLVDDSPVSPAEAAWVIQRLAELHEWRFSAEAIGIGGGNGNARDSDIEP